MQLRVWQQALQDHVLQGDQRVLDTLAGGAAARTGLAIYAQAYRARLLEALTDIYPGLQALAGDAILQAFIEDEPPRVANLRDYGATLATWLEHLVPACPVEWIAMARLEWALAQVFQAVDAPQAVAADLAALSAEQWPSLVLRPVPAWQCLRLPSGLVACRRALLDPAGTGLPPTGRKGRQHWLLWRDGTQEVQQRPLDDEEAVLVDGLLAGASLAELCERLATLWPPDQVAARMLGWIRLWMAQGWIAALDA